MYNTRQYRREELRPKDNSWRHKIMVLSMGLLGSGILALGLCTCRDTSQAPGTRRRLPRSRSIYRSGHPAYMWTITPDVPSPGETWITAAKDGMPGREVEIISSNGGPLYEKWGPYKLIHRLIYGFQTKIRDQYYDKWYKVKIKTEEGDYYDYFPRNHLGRRLMDGILNLYEDENREIEWGIMASNPKNPSELVVKQKGTGMVYLVHDIKKMEEGDRIRLRCIKSKLKTMKKYREKQKGTIFGALDHYVRNKGGYYHFLQDYEQVETSEDTFIKFDVYLNTSLKPREYKDDLKEISKYLEQRADNLIKRHLFMDYLKVGQFKRRNQGLEELPLRCQEISEETNKIVEFMKSICEKTEDDFEKNMLDRNPLQDTSGAECEAADLLEVNPEWEAHVGRRTKASEKALGSKVSTGSMIWAWIKNIFSKIKNVVKKKDDPSSTEVQKSSTSVSSGEQVSKPTKEVPKSSETVVNSADAIASSTKCSGTPEVVNRVVNGASAHKGEGSKKTCGKTNPEGKPASEPETDKSEGLRKTTKTSSDGETATTSSRGQTVNNQDSIPANRSNPGPSTKTSKDLTNTTNPASKVVTTQNKGTSGSRQTSSKGQVTRSEKRSKNGIFPSTRNLAKHVQSLMHNALNIVKSGMGQTSKVDSGEQRGQETHQVQGVLA